MKWWIRGNNKINIPSIAKNEYCEQGMLSNQEFNNSNICIEITKNMPQTRNGKQWSHIQRKSFMCHNQTSYKNTEYGAKSIVWAFINQICYKIIKMGADVLQ